MWWWLAIGAVAAVLGYRQIAEGRRLEAARRELTRWPETPIGAVAEGQVVRLRARALANAPARMSPISQRSCVGFRLTIDCRDGASFAWQRVLEDDAFDVLRIADDTGEAALHGPFDIKLAPYRESVIEAPSAALASLLERHSVPASEVFAAGRQFRCVETIVVPGHEVIAIGRATIEIDPSGRSLSHRDPPVMCHLKGREARVVIADADERARRVPT